MRADIVDRVLLILPDSMRKLIQMFVHILREARTKLLASVAVRFGSGARRSRTDDDVMVMMEMTCSSQSRLPSLDLTLDPSMRARAHRREPCASPRMHPLHARTQPTNRPGAPESDVTFNEANNPE